VVRILTALTIKNFGASTGTPYYLQTMSVEFAAKYVFPYTNHTHRTSFLLIRKVIGPLEKCLNDLPKDAHWLFLPEMFSIIALSTIAINGLTAAPDTKPIDDAIPTYFKILC